MKYICPDDPGCSDLFEYKANESDLLQDSSLSDTSVYNEVKHEPINDSSLLTQAVKSDLNLFPLASETLLSSLPGNKDQTLNISQLSSAQQLQQAALKLQAQQQKQLQQQQLLQLLLQQQQQQQQQQQKLTLTTQQLKLLLLEYQNQLSQQQQTLHLQQPVPLLGQTQATTNNVLTLQTLQQVNIPYRGDTPVRWQLKKLILSTNIDQNSLEIEFWIDICRNCATNDHQKHCY